MKVSFDIPLEDYENLMSILQKYIRKYKYETQIDHSFTTAEKEWFVKHADYVQKEILDRIIDGTERKHDEY